MAQLILFEVVKSDTRKVVVMIDEYKGNNFLSIKEMWRENDKQEWMFSKKIVTMGYRDAQEFMKKIRAVDEDKFFEALLGKKVDKKVDDAGDVQNGNDKE
jgi:hypothetical protein